MFILLIIADVCVWPIKLKTRYFNIIIVSFPLRGPDKFTSFSSNCVFLIVIGGVSYYFSFAL